MKKEQLNFLVQVVFVLITLVIIAVLLIKRFVYFHPSRHFLPTMETYKPVQVGHINGAMLEYKGKTDRVILYCHGNAGNISHCESEMVALRNLGYDVVCFDYSGFGRSGGIPSEQQLYDDASLMVSFLRQYYDHDKIIPYGFSMGGAVASYVALRFNLPILILQCPIPSIRHVAQVKMPWTKWVSFLFPEFDTEKYLQSYKGRSLLIYSVHDQQIPPNSLKHLLDYCTKTIRTTGSHMNTKVPWNEVQQFIQQS